MKLWMFGAALAVALLPLVAIHPSRIQGESMRPTLEDGATVWVLRSWLSSAPKRGEMWLVESPDGVVIKRVVALPGETLVQRHGELWLNQVPLDEPYVRYGERADGGPWESGSGYLLLGDNRPDSRDGRVWGSLPLSALHGRILSVAKESYDAGTPRVPDRDRPPSVVRRKYSPHSEPSTGYTWRGSGGTAVPPEG